MKIGAPALILVAVFVIGAAQAAEDDESPALRLLDQGPYDVLVLNDREHTTEKIFPLKLPGRRLPAAPPAFETFRVQLMRDPDEEYEVRWGDVAEVKLFEQLLLDEADRLLAAGLFDEAFEYFVRLRREQPSWP